MRAGPFGSFSPGLVLFLWQLALLLLLFLIWCIPFQLQRALRGQSSFSLVQHLSQSLISGLLRGLLGPFLPCITVLLIFPRALLCGPSSRSKSSRKPCYPRLACLHILWPSPKDDFLTPRDRRSKGLARRSACRMQTFQFLRFLLFLSRHPGQILVWVTRQDAEYIHVDWVAIQSHLLTSVRRHFTEVKRKNLGGVMVLYPPFIVSILNRQKPASPSLALSSIIFNCPMLELHHSTALLTSQIIIEANLHNCLRRQTQPVLLFSFPPCLSPWLRSGHPSTWDSSPSTDRVPIL